MLEDQVANLLQRYLGDYVRGLNKEALKISVWQGNVELTNMQLKPEALNALKLPVKVKAGFLGSVKLKVPWSRLGQDPVLVYLDRIFLLAEPATQVEGCNEDAIQEAKKSLVREMEMKLVERSQQLKSEMNKSWLGSLISTIIGNLKLSISNIHIRYEDLESNPGHPFAAGITLEKLSAVTVDDNGKETFVTGGALDWLQKSVELDRLALYLDSDTVPWHLDKPWEDLLPSEWLQVFRFGTKDGKPGESLVKRHSYVLQPVSGNAKYSKLRHNAFADSSQPLQKAAVNLDDVTMCLSKDGYRDILKLAENFAAFNQRLKYAHYRPNVSVKSDPRSWWKYAYKVISDQLKKASGKLSWEQVLRFASLQKKYISLYALLLKSDHSRAVVDDNKDIEELDRGLDIDLILQWRMLAHKFVEKSVESDTSSKHQKAKKSWWSFGGNRQPIKDEAESFKFTEEDWEQLNKIIGYKEGEEGQSFIINDQVDALQTFLEVHMKHYASKLLDEAQDCLAELSCEGLDCSIKLYPETKAFDLKLGSYRLSSPNGLLAESATTCDSLVGIFCYKPFNSKVDWSMVARASPCYMTYLKDSIDQIVKFFESNTAVSQTIALETAAAVQMTIDGVKRTAQQQVNKALKDQARFLLDLDIAAPKITIPTDFRPDNSHSTKLLLDLGNLLIRTQDDYEGESSEEFNKYLQFNLVLSDVSVFLVDGDYHWSQNHLNMDAGSPDGRGFIFLPVLDKCGVILRLQQIRLENPSYPSARLAVRLPSLGFHFSPARYHRLMQVIKIFQGKESEASDILRPWNQADFEGWLSLLSWKGVGNREAVWKKRYFCLVGPFLYVLEGPDSKSYKRCISLRGKQIYQVPPEYVGGAEHVLAICDAARTNSKVVEDVNAVILQCDSEDSRKAWQSCLQGAIYRASGAAPISGLSETSSDPEDSEAEPSEDLIGILSIERLFLTGVLDELKVCFSYSHQRDQSFMNVLLAKEDRLFEFRAIGGQVELSIIENDMFIGTVLKSLEIEDLVCRDRVCRPCFLARSFIGSGDAYSSFCGAGDRKFASNGVSSSGGSDKFYEAPENLVDSVDNSIQSPRNESEYLGSGNLPRSEILSLKPPSFKRTAGLLPTDAIQTKRQDNELTETLDSFVKAQIIIYDQTSPRYNNTDKQVTVTLATLSFFCRRPTVVAIMEFVNAINIKDERSESSSDNSSAAIVKQDVSNEDVVDGKYSMTVGEPVIKGLLGKGKSRIMFNIKLHMAHAQIVLMNDDETKLSSLSQDKLLTDIKVFPSSVSIKAALGNLRISDDSLPSTHMYFWVCDMRNPGGSSFVELAFTSYSADDEDYEGYEYSLFGQLSEVRIVYLNRFVQEVVSYFMGLVPNNSKAVVKLKDQVTNSEKWFTASEFEGSPAVKLDLSLRKPVILMPRRTDSPDYLKLDIVHITVKNTFQWFGGHKCEMNAVHLEILTVQVEDINLNVGTGTELGESIIQDVNDTSIVIRRSLRDLLHQIPNTEVTIKIQELKAALSSREYQIISECAISNISETPHVVPPLKHDSGTSSVDAVETPISQNITVVECEASNGEAWIVMKVSVIINLAELSLHTGAAKDASLATVQISGAWLLYKSDTLGEGFLSATLKDFTVIDNREGTDQEFKLAIGKAENSPIHTVTYDDNQHVVDSNAFSGSDIKPVSTMLIIDAKFSKQTTFFSFCVQRPQMLVALDFLLAVVEFFVPSVSNMLSNEEDKNSLHVIDAIILDQSTYMQPFAEVSVSLRRPLIADDERCDHFVYDGNSGVFLLKDRLGSILSAPSLEPIIFVGSGKKLQFKNVVIKNGQYLDSCVFLGANSSYSVSKDDQVYLEEENEISHPSTSRERINDVPSQDTIADRCMEFVIELQAIGPELTFYNKSKDVGESLVLSNQLLHAQLDAFCRFVSKGDTIEMSANALGLTMESNGITILEPFDTSFIYSNASGKTNIHLSVSDIFMNFSFSILRLFLAVEEDILAFLRMTSKKMTVVCSQFDKVGTIKNPDTDQVYAFWRPHAPPGFAVLGDYLTPLDKPPLKGVVAVNTNLARVKRPISFKLIWSPLFSGDISDGGVNDSESSVSIWFPEAPKGYVSLGCVVSPGKTQPPLSSTFCILASLVGPCSLRDRITIKIDDTCLSRLSFSRVDNSVGTFLPADPGSFGLKAGAYDLRHMIFGLSEDTMKAPSSSDAQASPSGRTHSQHSVRSSAVNSGRRFEAVASFRLIWWNQGSNSRKKLSIWRPVVPQGMVYFGDIAVKGYEPPNSCIVLHDSGDEEVFKVPLGFQLVGQIKKQKGMENISFWLPQPPPGFVSPGCIASKGTPKQDELSGLRCIRSDMVTVDQFLEEPVWNTSDAKFTTEPFSIWLVDNELGTFIARSGSKRPPRRFALKLADSSVPSGSDHIVIDAEIKTFSAALFDDYSGLMVPLFNVSFSGIGFSLHGRTDYLSSTVNFSLAARSYNDKYDSWEPLVEPVDGFLRYHYDLNSPGAASQLRITSTRDLNLNLTVSNANLMIQAYASWNNLSHVNEYNKKREAFSPTNGGRSIIDIHHRRNYFIIPQNKLGQDIYIRATEIRGVTSVNWMPPGDAKPVEVPVSKALLDSHLKGHVLRKVRTMVTVIVVDAQIPRLEGLTFSQYTIAIRLTPNQNHSTESQLHQQSARTCGSSSDNLSSELELVSWNEVFFFKVDSPDFYMVELIVTNIGKGDPIGYFSAPLKQMSVNIQDGSSSLDYMNKLTWINLSSTTNMIQSDGCEHSCGRIRCAILMSPTAEVDNRNQPGIHGRKSGNIQISPSREGPWTTVGLNYSAPAACWRFDSDVVASEVSVRDGSRYVNIRSLASIRNNTDFTLDLCLASKASKEEMRPQDDASDHKSSQIDRVQRDEFFEIEEYDPAFGWVGRLVWSSQDISQGRTPDPAISGADIPVGWEWIDDWHVDKTSNNNADGWVYASDVQSLKWPKSSESLKFGNHARQRRWIRSRKQISCDLKQNISIGLLKPGDTVPVPLCGLSHTGMYVLQLRPYNPTNPNEYSWSSVVDKPGDLEDTGDPNVCSEICVSALTESEALLYCTQISGTSTSGSDKAWFCLSIQATEIGKDIRSNPIQDWSLVVKSPLTITNFLPLAAEYSVLEMQTSDHFVDCSRGVFGPGKTENVYSADIRNPLFFSLLPQRGWLPLHEAVPISHPPGTSSKTISLKSSISGRVVQIILEHNCDKEQPLLAKIIRVYAPYWFAVARCPPLTFRLVYLPGRNHKRKIALPFQSMKKNKVLFEEITEEEIFGGVTIASALDFNNLGLSVSIAQSGKEQFGSVKDLSPLGDMDGSLDLYASDGDGNCIRLFISTKPCPYQSVPTKVISVRPFMTFTNRVGQDMFMKFCSEDVPKILHASDSRTSFVHRETGGLENLQVQLEDTNWSFPIQIVKEDTIYLVLRRQNGTRRFLRIEIRGYEEGSRFVVVFRLGSTNGPIRIENRAPHKTISIRQSGLGEDAWIQLQPLSTINFAWEDPYGQRDIDARVVGYDSNSIWKLNLERAGLVSAEEPELRLQFLLVEMGDIKVARFMDLRTTGSSSDQESRCPTLAGIWGNSFIQTKMQNNAAPVELTIELGVVGISVVDHRPKELSYLYLERVFISYSTGYDGGTTSRFKLIMGYLQLDNQLPLTVMPVLLAPEQTSDVNHPVFKTTITIRNTNTDGILVYPYVYIRVTEKWWRLNIHEPIIWALLDFYNNLQLDRIPQSSSVTEVDPEIRIELIDISEVRLKVSLETAPAQRPHGVLGVWSPILSAVGNALKIQVHLRTVMHRDRFMRKSSIIPAIAHRIWRDLIHNPLHLIFSVDVLGMTSSTLASLSKGFAELSTDGQFLQLRSKQARRITGVGDGIIKGTEALAQGFAFGVSGVVTKPVESARQNGLLGLAHGLGRAVLGVVVQPMSGALDFFSMTVDGIGASLSKCLEGFTSKTTFQRIRNPRAIHADGVLREYCEREAIGQMILYLAEGSRHFGCAEIFKEPSKFSFSDYYEAHFFVPYDRIVLVTNKRVMLLQCPARDKIDKKPSKIMWDVPWEELMAVELAKAGSNQPSHLILHLKHFKRSETFVRVIKCRVEEGSEGREPQAVGICSVLRKMWKASDLKVVALKVPSKQRYVYFAWNEADGRDLITLNKATVRLTGLSSDSPTSSERRFVRHTVNFLKIWSSERESKGSCILRKKQVLEDGGMCSIWRPICPDGYVSIGDIARVGSHAPNVAAVYSKIDRLFARPVGYDLNMIQSDGCEHSCGRIRCAILMSPTAEVDNRNQPGIHGRKSGNIQISPSREGPWTTVGLNYSAPAACWRFDSDVVASEVSVRDGSRYVNIRSLASIRNNTDFTLDLCLASKASKEEMRPQDDASDHKSSQIDRVQRDEFFEIEEYDPAFGWVGRLVWSSQDISQGRTPDPAISGADIPVGWEWIDDWHVDKTSNNNADGWVYASDVQSLKWPKSSESLKFGNHARQRRWIRSRKQISCDLKQNISIGLLKPGDTVPVPLCGLSHTGMYVLQLRPYNPTNPNEYSWSSVVDKPGDLEDTGDPNVCSEICVSALTESEALLYCTQISGTSTSGSDKAWFCLSIQATEIGKDIRSNPIQDWSLVVKSPLTITNFLPLAAEYSVLEMQTSDHFVDCSRGVFGPGKTENVYSADIRNPLFFSLLPQRGWLPLHEAVPISHPPGTSSKTISLKSSISGRVVQIILEHNCDKEQPLLAKIIRVYAPYWFAVARCPPLTFRLVYLPGRNHKRKIALPFQSMKKNKVLFEEITEEEIFGGVTIASALDFNNLGLSVSIAQSGKEQFGSVKDLSPLGDMDGSLDLYASDGDGNCIRLFISTKPCPYQSVPTKVISVRPFMTFTNRVGQDMFMKFCSEDVPKILHASDSRTSFVHRETGGLENLQVQLEDTNWSFPIQIVKEDTIYLVLRRQNGTRRFLRIEIRGYEEGSRFVVVFRLGSTNGPIRIENRAPHKTISIRQSGLGEDAWIQLQPLSTINFAWEDPYGQRDIDARVVGYDSNSIWKLNLERAGLVSAEEPELRLQFLLVEMGDIKVARFMDLRTTGSSSDQESRCPTLAGIWGNSFIQTKMQNNAAPVELTIELGVVGISVVDHRPKELSYLYLERVFISYSTGYDGGTTSRFKLIMGYLQLDNQLPLTVMPVLLAPEQTSDVNHPVFKTTITIRNTNTDGILVYPYVYIRVTEKWWRLNIHEPIIWALLDFYNNLQLDRIPQSSSVTEVDPEIRIELIDISEVRLKVSLETAPAQRPHGVLGVWSPILSAVGNALKIQVHLRTVMHRDRFMRKSSIIPAIAHRIWRDLIHNPLHLIFSVDVLGMTSSTLASLSKGFAELSTDGQFLQLRSKQARRITGVGDGIIKGTEALAQGFAFGVSGVVTKPVESARQNGLLGLAHGLGRAVLGVVVQPMSGALDFFSMTVDGIGASLSKCLEGFTSKTTFQRIRNPRAIHADGVLREYCEREAIGQMILYLAEGSRHFGCAEIFKEPSKFSFSDYYEAHFFVPYDRIVLVTNKRVMLLQCPARDKIDKKPSKIMWDVPWEELMAVELAKAGSNQPSHLILHLKHFKRSETFVRVIKCRVEEGSEGREPQAVGICSVLRKMWKASDLKVVALKVPSKQRYVYFAWNEADGRDLITLNKATVRLTGLSSDSPTSSERRFVRHTVNFLKIWSSERESKGSCILRKKQVLEDGGMCSIWRPICPDGYVSIGDIARVGSHAPNVAAVYSKIDRLFARPVGYDLVWRNCLDDYLSPVSIWHPRAPEGYVSPGFVAVADFREPEPDLVYCVAVSLAEETQFEEQKVWSAPDPYPWACNIYQVQSDALHFVALRQRKEESDWKPMRVRDDPQPVLQSSDSEMSILSSS